MEDVLNGFDEFWRIYPRRIAKLAARRRYKHALKSAAPAVILEGASRYAKERAGEDPLFTKHPATWLNGACWDDEPTGKRNGPTDATMAAFDRLIARAEGGAVEGDHPMRDITPRRASDG